MVDVRSITEYFPEIHPTEGTSVLARYIEAHDEASDLNEATLEEIRESHYVDLATGDELDEIGKMFGQLGRRSGRSDSQYRGYLKSLVDAFSGVGRKQDIINAVSPSIGIPESNLSIDEYFQDNEYQIVAVDWPAHDSGDVEFVADLADPSGVDFLGLVYLAEAATVTFNVTAGSESQTTGDMGTGTLGTGVLGGGGLSSGQISSGTIG